MRDTELREAHATLTTSKSHIAWSVVEERVPVCGSMSSEQRGAG